MNIYNEKSVENSDLTHTLPDMVEQN